MAREVRFRKALRLRHRREFLAVQRGGLRHHGHLMPLIALKSTAPEARTRLGITASRRVGCAVRRNRTKRLVREAFRLERERLPRGMDLVAIARPSMAEAAFDDVRAELVAGALALGRRLRLAGER